MMDYEYQEQAKERLSMSQGGLTGIGSRPCPVIERDKPEIIRAIDDLKLELERYDDLVGRLHDRINTVVVPAPPTEAGIEKAREYQTGLGNCINGMRCKLRDINTSLQSLLERIEL
jgi:hypothetical protein